MTIHFFSGFESGETAEEVLASGGTLSVQSTTVKTGTYALRVNPTTTAVGWVEFGKISASTGAFGANIGGDPAVFGFHFRAAALPAASEEIACTTANGSTLNSFVRITSAGKLRLYNADGTTQVGSDSSATIAADTWYHIEISIAAGSAGACVGSVKVNGTTDISTSAGTFGATSADLDTVRIGKMVDRNGNTVDFFYDNPYYADSFLGECFAGQMLPDGAGTYTAWTAGTGASDYQECDELPPDDGTSYVQSVAAEDVQTFTVQSTTTAGVSGTIHAASGVIRHGRVAAGGNRRMRVRSGSTNSDTSSAASGSAYGTMFRLLETDPDTAAAWTLSALDAVEVGGICDAGSTAQCRMSWAAINVLYTPSGGSTYNETITTEAATAAESLTSALVAANFLSDALAAAEALTSAWTGERSLSDAGTADEALTSAWTGEVALSESGAAAETTDGDVVILLALSESAAADEALSTALDAVGALSEAGTAAEALTSLMDAVAAIAEALTAIESTTGETQIPLSLTEAVTASEAIVAALVAVDTLTESGAVDDAIAALLVAVAALTEAGAAAEELGDSVVGGGSTYNESLAEAITAAEALVAALTAVGALSESGTAGETLVAALTAANALSEVLSCAEAYGTALEGVAACSEAGAANDALTGLGEFVAALNEAGNAADVIAGVIFVPVTIFDTLHRTSSLADRNVIRSSPITRTVRGVSKLAE